MLIVNMCDVLTMSESSDIEMIMVYQNFVRQSDKKDSNDYKLDRKMGYLGNVNDTKEILEKIFKSVFKTNLQTQQSYSTWITKLVKSVVR